MVERVESEMTPTPSALVGSKLFEIIEALLFVGSTPLDPQALANACPDILTRDVEQAIRELRMTYGRQKRPYTIVRQEDGYHLEIIDPYRSEIAERMHPKRQVKLNRASIDVLSVVAYRQPIDKPAIDEIMGIDTSSTLRQLVRRGLLTIEKGATGDAPACYVTAPRFLELFGLESLADVPASDDLEKM